MSKKDVDDFTISRGGSTSGKFMEPLGKDSTPEDKPEAKAKVFIFNDGSKECQVLEYESLKNPFIQIEKIKVEPKPDNIESYILRLPKSVLNSNDITKVHLHFTSDDFAENNIAEQKSQLATKYPNLSIFYAYELLSRETAELRYNSYLPDQESKTSSNKKPKQA